MSMDEVFHPEARKWISPRIHLEERLKQMQLVKAELMAPVDNLWANFLRVYGDSATKCDDTPILSEEEKEADKLRRERIFGKPLKKRKGRKKGKKGEDCGDDKHQEMDGEDEDDDPMSFYFDDDEMDSIPSDPEDYINMQNSSDDDEDNKDFEDSDCQTSSEDEIDNMESDNELDDNAFKKMQEEHQPNTAASAEQDEKNFALHYKYCLFRARVLDKRAQEKERRYLELYFGFSEEKYNSVWRLASPYLATTKAEVIVDDAIFKNTEMPLLAGAIPPHAVKKLSSLAIYTTLSDEPGSFQWRMVNVVDQLSNDLKYSKQNYRARQLDMLCAPDVVSSDPDDCIMTVTMYQSYEVPEGDYFYDLKTSQEPKLGLVVEMLTSQTLETLTKFLKCQSDYMCITDMTTTFSTGNSEELIQILENDLSGNQYKSKIIYVDNKLYTEGGQKSKEFVKRLNAWVRQVPKKEILPFKISSLKKTKLKDMNLRFGYPYLYHHQGDCEHILVFNGVRATRRVEYDKFPRFECIGKYPTKYCRVDNESLARWAVVGYDRVPEDPMLLCTDCVNQYCFNGTERIGNFKLFPFLQFLHYI